MTSQLQACPASQRAILHYHTLQHTLECLPNCHININTRACRQSSQHRCSRACTLLPQLMGCTHRTSRKAITEATILWECISLP